MPNTRRSAPESMNRKYLRDSNKHTNKVPPVRRVIRVRDFARLRRSPRLKEKYANIVDENDPSINGTSPEGVVNITEVLQEIHFLVQVYRFLDVKSSSQLCNNSCSFCNQDKGDYKSLATLMVSEFNRMHRSATKEYLSHTSGATTSVTSGQNNSSETQTTSNLDPSPPPVSTIASSSGTINYGSGYTHARSLVRLPAHPNTSHTMSQRGALYSGSGRRSEQTIATMIRGYRKNLLNNHIFVRPLPPTSERRRRQGRLRSMTYQPYVQLPPIQPADTPQPVNVNDINFDIDTTLFPELYFNRIHRAETKEHLSHTLSDATTSVASGQNNSSETQTTSDPSARDLVRRPAHPNMSHTMSQRGALYSGIGRRSEQTTATMIRGYRNNFLNNHTFVRPLPPTSERRSMTYQPNVQLPTIQPADTPQPVNINDTTFDIDTTLFPELYM